MQVKISADNVEAVTGNLTDLITGADEADQTTENLEVVTGVLGDAAALIDSGDFTVTEDVCVWQV